MSNTNQTITANNEKIITKRDVQRIFDGWDEDRDRGLALFFAIQEQVEKGTAAWHLAGIGYDLLSDARYIYAEAEALGITIGEAE
jgi:hypothetical protein